MKNVVYYQRTKLKSTSTEMHAEMVQSTVQKAAEKAAEEARFGAIVEEQRKLKVPLRVSCPACTRRFHSPLSLARVACCMTTQFSCAAPIALQLAARHRPRAICHTRDGRSMDATCCMLHAACRLSRVACCMLPPEQAVSACTHEQVNRGILPAMRARNVPRRFVGMALADEVVGRSVSRLHAHTE
jgi:hypothetical protein